MSELPSGWARVTVGGLLRVHYGKAAPRTDDGEIPVVASAGTIRHTTKGLTDGRTLVVGRKGGVGRIQLLNGPAWPTDTTYYISVGQELSAEFLYYQMSSIGLERLDRSTAVPSLQRQDLEAASLVIPPRLEQDRIVAAIEEQFSRLDAGVAALERVRQGLRRMRAAAFEAVRQGDYPSVPLGSLGDGPGSIVDGPFGSNLKTEHYTSDGPRVIRLQNIGDGEFIDAQAHITAEHFFKLQRHAVKSGDLVCAILGEVLPKAVIVPEGIGPAIVKADCPRIRLTPEVNTTFVWGVLNAPGTRHMVATRIRGVGRPRLTLKALREVQIPMPDRPEQDRRALRLTDELARISRLDSELADAQRHAGALRSSILAAAFSGNLVAQDPADEPASVLLLRVASERSSSNGHTPRRSRGSRVQLEEFKV